MAKLYLICGHGAGDPGAGGFGFNEAERVRALAARIKELGSNEVEILDPSVNWYETGGINSLTLPAGAQLVELHMDSAVSSARGGHVIIWGGYGPDEYDNALAAFLREFFPGRSSLIVPRYDLANVNRAANRGISYRLVENCFISNWDDLNKFNNNLDTVARGYLKAFNIKEVGIAVVEPAPVKPDVKEETPVDPEICPTCGQPIVKKLSNKEKAVETMLHLVNHEAHGYTQGNRWGNGEYEWITLSDGSQVKIALGDRDCSSAIVSVWEAIDPGCMGNATYTGNYYSGLMSTGKWKWHPWEEDYELSYGDIVINFTYHVEMCVTNTYDLAGFNLAENGGIFGVEGDQTGFESYVKAFYEPSYGWDGIFEYIGEDSDVPVVEPEADSSAIADQQMVKMQECLNERLAEFGLGTVAVTGNYDLATQLGLIKLYQASCNIDYNAGLDIDGWYGNASRAITTEHPIGLDYETVGNDVWVVKAALVGNGHDVDVQHWRWDEECDLACRAHQPYHGLEVDGICGPATMGSLIPLVNV